MKTQRTFSRHHGFTLMELMVAMAITTIIVTVLVSVTSIATDTWNRSRSELRASRQAKAMIEVMAKDFEALVVRRGNQFEWLSAETPSQLPGDKLTSSNAVDLIFFTAATDRYNGEIGKSDDNGGDISCVAYGLDYRDPIEQRASQYQTFVMNRLLVNPDEAFENLLGKDDLKSAFSPFENKLEDVENFICENIYQFTVVFHVEVAQITGGITKLIDVPVIIGTNSSGNVTDSFKIKGTGIDTSASSSGVTNDELKAGRLTSVEISLTVLSDLGVNQLRNRNFSGRQAEEFLAEHSYQYSKLVKIPSM